MDINDLLTSTMKKEQKLLKINLETIQSVSVSFAGDTFNLHLSQGTYSKRLDLPVMHQILNRVGISKKSPKEIATYFKNRISIDKFDFEQQVASGLKSSDTILLLDEEKNLIYGIVSSNFEFMNQFEIRDEFINQYKIYGFPSADEYNVGFTKFNEPFEKFTFSSNTQARVGEEIGYSVFLIYGLNNGYSSYRVFLGREILVCSNGMTSIENAEFARLKHLKNPDIRTFINDIYETINRYDTRLQMQIERAKRAQIRQQEFEELFQRLHVSQAVKNRVLVQFQEEKLKTNNSEWSLSQSFTNVGTHFYGKSKDRHHEKMLISVGSEIIDSSLGEFLNSSSKKEKYGDFYTYGSLLPKK
jgi:hypothetical protein